MGEVEGDIIITIIMIIMIIVRLVLEEEWDRSGRLVDRVGRSVVEG